MFLTSVTVSFLFSLFQGTFTATDQAAYQEFAIVETDIIAKTPDNISDDQASTISTGAITAYYGLFQRRKLVTIQFARIAGFSHIVTTASSQHTDFLKSLGASHVFDRDANVETIQSAFPTPVDLVFDTISIDSTQSLAFDVLTTPSPVPGARLSIVLNPVDSLKKKNAEDKIVVDEIFGSSQMFRDLSVPFWKKVAQWIEQGKLVPNPVQLVNGGLAGIPAALDLSRKGVSGVKLVVRPWE
ncbi:Zinc-type alcohol dehydrogenase-like protein C2E1P3.01 [Rhizoctonia solani AG-1 IB]|uniref:Zinc-type alcohol dehydrogenase-like protein C2E1P3.01 n=1 Tax=Thanatephorus cucumeris (strain AG1-IB / isolate 7/3/14) TaxID=1108050 RepID=M5C051_THACB|nr:Zinc-type alcohol dehydrogenase-like protein C2E1P3.01 [Rhizoctonia solani AG-1 IB]